MGKVPQDREETRGSEECSCIPYLFGQLADSVSTTSLFLIYE